MKKLRLLLFVLITCGFTAQATPDTSTLVPVTVSGIVNDALTGTGVPMHKVYFLTDSFSTVNIYDSVLTSSNGNYTITFMIPSNTLYQLEVYTYDCMNSLHDSLVGSPYYTFIIDFSVCDSIIPACFAHFSFSQDPLNPYKFQFTDNSTGNINHWQWDFGDGMSSLLKDPSHTYPGAGSYFVKLTASDSIPDPYCYSVDSQLVVINFVPMYNLGGQVFAGLFPQSSGQVVLYKTATTEYLPLDTASLNQNGVYFFYQLPAGDYVVKAISPDDPWTVQRYFPSYSQGSIEWQSAATVHLSLDLFNTDIALSAVEYVAAGPGTVKGDVSLVTTTTPLALPRTEILLLDSLMKPIDYTFSAADGTYLFYGIPPGIHYVKPEIPGMTCQAVAFQAGSGFPDTVEVSLLVPGNPIGIDEPGLLYHASGVFPNPAHAGSAIELDLQNPAKGSLQLVDLTGRMIKQTALQLNAGFNSIILPLESMPDGIYFLRIQLSGYTPVHRKFLLRNEK